VVKVKVHNKIYVVLNTSTTAANTHTQPFYSSLDFVWNNPGEPVPEETTATKYLII